MNLIEQVTRNHCPNLAVTVEAYKGLFQAKYGAPSVAEILSKQGYSLKSYAQIFPNAECNQPLQYRFIPANTPEASELLNKSLISLLNAHKPKSAPGVVDGLYFGNVQGLAKP